MEIKNDLLKWHRRAAQQTNDPIALRHLERELDQLTNLKTPHEVHRLLIEEQERLKEALRIAEETMAKKLKNINKMWKIITKQHLRIKRKGIRLPSERNKETLRPT